MASDLNKHYANSIKNLSRKPPTHHHYQHRHRLSSPLQPNDRKKQVQESPTTQPRNLPKVRPSSAPTSDDGKLLQVYPFVEDPVSFTFGDPGYGDHLFVAVNDEITYERPNYGRLPWLGGPVRETKYRREEIYELSSEAEMIAAFLDDDLL